MPHESAWGQGSDEAIRGAHGGRRRLLRRTGGHHQGAHRPNGAGKSTLFNALTGFERPDQGSVTFEGRELVGRHPRDVVRAGLARTFQNTQLFDGMSALENVMVGAQAHQPRGFVSAALRLPWATAEDRDAKAEAARLLRLIGIHEWAETPAADLPSGIRRLLEIARALADQAAAVAA